jgi:hypothetical protein
MTAVYNEQDWPKTYEFFDSHKIKTYIEQLFEDSHNYQIQLSPTYYCSGCKTRSYRYSCGGCKTDEDGNDYCSGHTGYEDYCDGHRDVIANIDVLGFDEIFGVDSIGRVPKIDKGWYGWDNGNIDWAKNFYNQDWQDLYGVSVGTTGAYVELTDEELEQLLGNIPEDISQSRKDVIRAASEAIGNIPYYWNWRQYYSIQTGLSANDFGSTVFADDYGRTKKGLDCSGFIVYVFQTAGISPQTAGWGSTASTAAIYNSPRVYEINKSELKIGDLGMLNTKAGTSNHVGIYAGNGKWIHCYPNGGAIISNYNFKIFLRLDRLD